MDGLTFLHLSDIHFRGEYYQPEGSANYAEPAEVANQLVEKLAEDYNANRIECPELVLVTGDIAYSGHPDEYRDASRLLNNLASTFGLKKSAFLPVPGNHDLDWQPKKPGDPGYYPWTGAKRGGGLGDPQRVTRENYRELFRDSKTAGRFFRPLENYNNWVKGYLDSTDITFTLTHRFFRQVRHLRSGLDLGVTGLYTNLNSFRLADKAPHLVVVGDDVLQHVQKEMEGAPSDLELGMGHHPASWYEVEAGTNRGTITALFDIYLQGHLHEAAFSKVQRNPPDPTQFSGLEPQLRLTAGSILHPDRSAWPNTASMVTLSLDEDAYRRSKSEIQVKLTPYRFGAGPRTWSEEGQIGGLAHTNTDSTTWHKSASQLEHQERSFISLFEGVHAAPVFSIGDLSCPAQIFPQNLGMSGNRPPMLFDEDREENMLELYELEFAAAPPPISPATIAKLKAHPFTSALANDIERGRAPYPRVPRVPRFVEDFQKIHSRLLVELAPGYFGQNFLRWAVSRGVLDDPQIAGLIKRFSFTALAVKVLLTFTRGGKKFGVFQLRSDQYNTAEPGAWDVSAAGYFDPAVHLDRTGRYSATEACRQELRQELGVPLMDLPAPEKYKFFGLCRAIGSGGTDVIGMAEAGRRDGSPSYGPAFIKEKMSKKVQEVAECEMTPESVAAFIEEKRHWTPASIVTIVYTLASMETRKYSYDEISNAFDAHHLSEKITFDPPYRC